MDIINSYFENINFTKIDEKGGFFVYGAGIASGLGGGKKRYVLLFVHPSLSYKSKAKIRELNWSNLQTRELVYSYKLSNQNWLIKRGSEDLGLIQVHISKDRSLYVPENYDSSIEVSLLHDKTKKTKYQHNKRITLSAAIESFNCSVDNKINGGIQNIAPTPVSYGNDSNFDDFELL